jgi:hypothetical protein
MNTVAIDSPGFSKGHGGKSIAKKNAKEREAHLSKPHSESTSTLREDLERALHEVKNHKLVRINPSTYKQDIKRRLSERD